MKIRIIRIGNSRGVRLPKSFIEQAGLGEDIEMRVAENSIILSRSDNPRRGWAEAAAKMAERAEDKLPDALTPTRFDEEEWQW